jgi:hypothetical protein
MNTLYKVVVFITVGVFVGFSIEFITRFLGIGF